MTRKKAEQSRKIDFVRAILDAVLDAAIHGPKDGSTPSMYYQVRHAVQHIEGYPGGFEEALTDYSRKQLMEIVVNFYLLYEEKVK